MNDTLIPESTPQPAAPPPVDSPAIIYALRWLIRDTFRQALASRIFWIMLAVSGLASVFCLGVSIDSPLAPPDPNDPLLYEKERDPKKGFSEYTGAKTGRVGKIALLYGFITVDWARHDYQAVRFLLVLLTSYVAGVGGFLLTLVWTAGFLPDFLQPGSAAVLLAKPIPRWTLLLGKYLGVIAFVAFQIAVFFLGTWLAISLRSGVWEYAYLAAIPLFCLSFAIIYSFAVLVATATRSTVACIFAIVLFWGLCWSLNLGRHYLAALDLASSGAHLAPVTGFVLEFSYWVLPKPADITILLEQALSAAEYTGTLSGQPQLRNLLQGDSFHPVLSILSSLAFSAVMIYASALQLEGTDY